jgi:hypothetical protein
LFTDNAPVGNNKLPAYQFSVPSGTTRIAGVAVEIELLAKDNGHLLAPEGEKVKAGMLTQKSIVKSPLIVNSSLSGAVI